MSTDRTADASEARHLQTERRFDMSNGPYQPLNVTLCQDALGPFLAIVDTGAVKINLHASAVLGLAKLFEQFRDKR